MDYFGKRLLAIYVVVIHVVLLFQHIEIGELEGYLEIEKHFRTYYCVSYSQDDRVDTE